MRGAAQSTAVPIGPVGVGVIGAGNISTQYLTNLTAFTGVEAHFVAIDGETPEGLPTVRDGVRSVQIVEAVMASARSGTWKEIAA